MCYRLLCVCVGLDALFIATNAPGRSAFNRCERRMAPLSKEMNGVILDHEHFGSHLDNQGNTIDPELELKNFEYAGEILSEIWSKLVIDAHPVVAEYIKDNSPHSPMQKVEQIRESKYFLQIVKCLDSNCFSPFRSTYLTVVKDRFLPPPVPVVQTKNGLKWVKDDKIGTYLSLHQNLIMSVNIIPLTLVKRFPEITYDVAKPAVQDQLKKRICDECDRYFGSIKEMNFHKKMCSNRFSQQRDEMEAPEHIRPIRVNAKRQGEYLSALAFQELEWHEIDNVDVDGLQVPDEYIITSGTSTRTLEVEELNK